LLYRCAKEQSTTSVNNNFREVLRVVIAVVLVISLIDVMSVLFLTFTGATTSIWIWIFAVPSRNVDEGATLKRRGLA
jgi:hypothetical protein